VHLVVQDDGVEVTDDEVQDHVNEEDDRAHNQDHLVVFILNWLLFIILPNNLKFDKYGHNERKQIQKVDQSDVDGLVEHPEYDLLPLRQAVEPC